MGTTAAVFDLDRTLLAGASGPLLAEALVDAGVLRPARVPGQRLAFVLYELIGETRPSMVMSRQAARATAGWRRDDVLRAGEEAAERLAAAVLPYARSTIEAHRAEGRQLVLATTSPHDLLAPFARELGFDALLATRYEVGDDGRYTGRVEGEFVWHHAKLRAVRGWADERGVDLGGSWAYSDSWYDVPLLTAVGHPHAVNPDPRLWGWATLRRWPVRFFDVPPGIPKVAGLELQRVVQLLARPELFPWVRFDLDGVDRLPERGPAILVANHRSYFDPLAIGFLLARRGRPVRFLGKKEVFDAPVVGDVARALGGIRVERGTGSDAPLAAAAEALAAGDLVAILPEGTIPRGEAFFDPELRGRWGAARLAAATGVPVVPIGLWGTEQVWPRSSKVPLVHQVLRPPTVRIRVGAPVPLGGSDPDADTRTIMGAIADLLPPEARQRRQPTPEELARTYPSGRLPSDADHERHRRPGED